MADRCTVHRLSVEKLSDAAADPALAALLAEGWDVLASVVVDEGSGPHLHLLMRPPVPAPVVAQAWPAWWMQLAAAGCLGAGVGWLLSWLSA